MKIAGSQLNDIDRCWSRFHVNIITGSGLITISFYKILTRNLKIGNSHVWVLPNIWRLDWVRNTKFSTNVSNKMLLNAAKCYGYSCYCFWVIKRKPTGVNDFTVSFPSIDLSLPSEHTLCSFLVPLAVELFFLWV